MLTLPLPRPLLRHPQPHALAACPCITDLPRRSCGSIASPSTRTWSGNQIRAQKNTSHETPEPPLLARTLTVLCCGLCLQTGPCGAFAQDITQSPSGARCLATLFWPAWGLIPSFQSYLCTGAGRAWASKQPKAPVQSTAERASTVLRLSSEAYAATDSLQFEQVSTASGSCSEQCPGSSVPQHGCATCLQETPQICRQGWGTGFLHATCRA